MRGDLVLVVGPHLEPVADARAEALGEERRHRAVDGELVRVPRVHQTTVDGPPSDGVVVAGEGVRFEHQTAVAGRHEEGRHEHDRLDRLDAGQACDVLVQGLAAQLGDEQVRVTAEVPGVAVGRGVGAAGAGGEAEGETADHADQDGRDREPGPVPADPPADAQRRRRHASTVRWPPRAREWR